MKNPVAHDTHAEAHRVLRVHATEQRVFALIGGDAKALHRRLPGPETVNNKWVKFVERCAAQGIEPASYIRRVFAIISPDIVPPTVQMIFRTQDVATHYDSLGQKIIRELTTILQSQTQLIERHLLVTRRDENGQRDFVRLAADPFVPLHPVIRLRLAERSKLQTEWRLTDPLVAEAVLSYGRTPDLFDEVWGSKWIHNDLHKRAPRDYAHLLGLGS